MKISAFQTPMMGTNCYMVLDETSGQGAVVDPGGAGDRIIAAIEKMDMTPAAIFLTHGHYDHTGAVQELKEKFPGVPVYLHPADAAQIGKVDSLMPDIGDTVPYDEGDEIAVGAMTFRVLHTPGHTGGSVTLDCGGALFTGDTMFAGNCGRTDLPGGSPDEMADSLKRLAQLEGDRQVLPGHEGFSTLERERTGNYWVRYALQR